MNEWLCGCSIHTYIQTHTNINLYNINSEQYHKGSHRREKHLAWKRFKLKYLSEIIRRFYDKC